MTRQDMGRVNGDNTSQQNVNASHLTAYYFSFGSSNISNNQNSKRIYFIFEHWIITFHSTTDAIDLKANVPKQRSKEEIWKTREYFSKQLIFDIFVYYILVQVDLTAAAALVYT